MKQIITSILILSCFCYCGNSDVVSVDEINQLIGNKNYKLAKALIVKEIQRIKPEDELLSNSNNKRNIKLSENREKIIWSEKNELHYTDINELEIEKIDFRKNIVNYSYSSDANFFAVQLEDKNKSNHCSVEIRSIRESSFKYTSTSKMKCNSSIGISIDGARIYFFQSEKFIFESIPDGKTYFVSKNISSPFPKLSTKRIIYPLGNHFIIFIGNAGVYNLYWYNRKSEKVEKISDNVLSPKIFPSDSTTAYFIGGQIGQMYLKKITYLKEKKPTIFKLFPISMKEINPWEISKKRLYLSGNEKQIFLWGPLQEKQSIPIFCKNFMGVANDRILCEKENNELILTDFEFNAEEWILFDIYSDIKNKI